MKKIIMILAAAFALSACVTEGLDPCPPNPVRIDIYVEKFGGVLPVGPTAQAAMTPDDYAAISEALFTDRVKCLEYLLYREDILVERGYLTEMPRSSDPYYVFQRSGLEPGDYKIALLGNCIELAELPLTPEDIVVVYPGYEETDDYFMTLFPFTVCNTDCGSQHFTTQLKRLHGVVNFSFRNIDPSITSIDVKLDGLTKSGGIMGAYTEPYSFEMTIPMDGSRNSRSFFDDPTLIGLFPTMEEGTTVWSVTAHTEDRAVPFFSGVALEDLKVVRNMRLNLETGFDNGQINFRVVVDPDWEDPGDGGNIIAN